VGLFAEAKTLGWVGRRWTKPKPVLRKVKIFDIIEEISQARFYPPFHRHI
jgi:hypothetical protein